MGHIEIGPQPVLLGMGRQCVVDSKADYTWLPSLRKDTDPWQTMIAALARLYVDGAPIDWRGFDSPYSRRTISLPAYAFNPKPYWLRSSVVTTVSDAVRDATPFADDVEGEPTDADSIDAREVPEVYEVEWRERELPVPKTASPNSEGKTRPTEARPARPWLIFADNGGLGTRFAQLLAKSDVHATLVFPGDNYTKTWDGNLVVNPRSAQDFQALWQSVCGAGEAPSIAYLWGLDSTAPASSAHLKSALRLLQTVVKGRHAGSRLWFVTQSAVNVGMDSSPIAVNQAMLWGFGRTIALEYSGLWGGLIDIAGDGDTLALMRG